MLQVNARSGGRFGTVAVAGTGDGDGDGSGRSPVVAARAEVRIAACAELHVPARCRSCPAGQVHTSTRAYRRDWRGLGADGSRIAR